jgi:4'-phosphopantetheinyl transferase
MESSGLGSRLHFNLSHSQEVALVAVALDRQVGVDVEKIAPKVVDDIGIAESLFTPGEAEVIRGASAEMRAELFYRFWTRKEAFLKGCGVGLSDSMNQFEVSLEEPEIRFLHRCEGGVSNWSVHEFRPCLGYVAAVAIETAHPKFKFLRIDSDL